MIMKTENTKQRICLFYFGKCYTYIMGVIISKNKIYYIINIRYKISCMYTKIYIMYTLLLYVIYYVLYTKIYNFLFIFNKFKEHTSIIKLKHVLRIKFKY